VIPLSSAVPRQAHEKYIIEKNLLRSRERRQYDLTARCDPRRNFVSILANLRELKAGSAAPNFALPISSSKPRLRSLQ